MTPTETVAILRQFNEWQRGCNAVLRPNSSDIGEAIDAAVELLDRLEVVEKDIALKERIIDALGSKLSDVANERYALRIKTEAMERQKPVGEIQRANSTGNYICSKVWVPLPVGSKLYALPGAKGE